MVIGHPFADGVMHREQRAAELENTRKSAPVPTSCLHLLWLCEDDARQKLPKEGAGRGN
ncbi:hypothetical protein [Pannonibacter phragmitetus]|uniref:hypothetical protein n=1 Tax=Pannonibacter phragmitetus TaxID=121719 RepID=UPI0013DE587E|nr:hypothetical protein [Pannonibacter phragmitetus]